MFWTVGDAWSSEVLRTAVRRQVVKQSAVLRSAFVFCSKLQRVSSEDRRTTVLGQAVNQSAELHSALVFFLAVLLRQ